MDLVLLFAQNAAENIFFYGFMFVVTLAIVIIVHELGHYWAARKCGVHVEQFAFGFGKEIFGFGGGDFKTRWSFCLFPLGGYVKLFGDVDVNDPVVWDHENDCKRTLSEEELRHAFCTKSVWQRVLIVAAGPAINLLLTLIIFSLVFATYGQRSKPLIINGLAVGTAAYEAGVKIGDVFIDMDGKKIRRLEDVYDFTWYETPPQSHEYTILRDGQIKHIGFTARHIEYIDKKGVAKSHGQTGMIRLRFIKFKRITSVEGISTKGHPEKARELLLKNMDKNIHIKLPLNDERADSYIIHFPSNVNAHLSNPDDEYYDRIFLSDPDNQYFVRLGVAEAFGRSLFSMKSILIQGYKLISVAHKGKTDEPLLGGIGKISQHTARAAKAGFYDYVMFIAGFSFMVAIINLLPIPVLDGGYLIFLFYELLRGKPVSARIQNIAMIIGLVILGGIMIIANISDLISMLSPIDSD
ncbi:MAG: RIP metalloprotease RseP [Alphaproteobacteria bacterium]|nr:MAG: RIP metalloprotease RseP [Alphaproteobacteria bacterium]